LAKSQQAKGPNFILIHKILNSPIPRFTIAISQIANSIADFTIAVSQIANSIADFTIAVSQIANSIADFTIAVSQIANSIADFTIAVSQIANSISKAPYGRSIKISLKTTVERPSDVQQCGEAADPGRQAAGPSEQRAAKRSAARRSRSGGP